MHSNNIQESEFLFFILWVWFVLEKYWWVLENFDRKRRRDERFEDLGSELEIVVHMFRKLRWLIGLNYGDWSAKRLLPTPPPPPQQQQQQQQQLPTIDATHEIAIYIHRFHNLDLYLKG